MDKIEEGASSEVVTRIICRLEAFRLFCTYIAIGGEGFETASAYSES